MRSMVEPRQHPTPRGVVLDTNVLVSALLGPGRVPDQLLGFLIANRVRVAYDARIRAEYEAVTSRAKFRSVPSARRERLLEELLGLGVQLEEVARFDGALGDESDRIFIEAAITGRAGMLITGNLKDYPRDLGFAVLPPATALEELSSASHVESESESPGEGKRRP